MLKRSRKSGGGLTPQDGAKLFQSSYVSSVLACILQLPLEIEQKRTNALVHSSQLPALFPANHASFTQRHSGYSCTAVILATRYKKS